MNRGLPVYSEQCQAVNVQLTLIPSGTHSLSVLHQILMPHDQRFRSDGG